MSVKNVLVEIFELDQEVWREPKRFKALLSDLLPEDKLKRNLLVLSVDEDIPTEISKIDKPELFMRH